MLFIHNFLCRTGLLLLLVALLFSCKKTEEYAKEVNDYPYLITGEIQLESIGKGLYKGLQRSYLVGDTLTLVGKFFVDKPGTQIRVGSQTIQPLEKYLLPHGINSYTKQTEYLDVLRFVITKEMGLGAHIPLSIIANGQTLQAPDISIRQFSGSMHRTDTTLYVEQLVNWKPNNADFYRNNGLPMINNYSVTADGAIYFGNQTEIDVCRDGKIINLINAGDKFQENGLIFTIKMIAGNVVAYDGSTLTFSAEVTEDVPEAATSYIFRLCKMDLATRKVTTLNRTLVTKGPVTVNENGGPFEGTVGNLKIVATVLKTDVNGAVYFVNNYSTAGTDHVNEFFWYKNGLGPSSYLVGQPSVYSNLCRVDAGGIVRSLFKQEDLWMGPSPYNIPGFSVQMTFDYVISPDGKLAFCNNQINLSMQYSFASYDLEHDEIQAITGFTSPPYHFFSYDTSAVTGIHEPELFPYFGLANVNYLSNFLYTPDGDLLILNGSSIAAVNLANKTLYCYAGTEMGLLASVPSQDKITGPAKDVYFSEPGTRMIGQDKQGTLFYTGPLDDYAKGVNFYRLYSRK